MVWPGEILKVRSIFIFLKQSKKIEEDIYQNDIQCFITNFLNIELKMGTMSSKKSKISLSVNEL